MNIREKLLEQGFDEKLSGTGYLEDCIRLYEGGRRRFLDIYEQIADEAGKTVQSVMKALKYAINDAVLSSRSDFLPGLVRDNGTVTVREFVAEFWERLLKS